MTDAQIASSPAQFILLMIVGALASGINSVAGGGSLLSFPYLVNLGIPTIAANATNAASLWPGSLGGAIGFLKLLSKTKSAMLRLIVPTILGTLCGGYLLLQTSQTTFKLVIPWLILFAALLLAFQPKIKAWTARQAWHIHPVLGYTIQFLVALYGGYFGAGMGIMMLATFALYIEGDIHELNAMKTWLGLLINLFATVVFIIGGQIWWLTCLALALGGIVGGYLAARISQKIDSNKLRIAIAGYGFVMVIYFFMR